MRYVIAVLAWLGSPALADFTEVPSEVVAQMGQQLEACWQDDGCTDAGALNLCGEAISAGGAPNAWAMCQQVIYDWWDGRLNAVYQDRMAQQKAFDADAGGTTYQDALREMQRAWIPLRDTACTFAARGQPGGSGAINDQMDCLIQMTITQVQFIAHPLTCLNEAARCTEPRQIKY